MTVKDKLIAKIVELELDMFVAVPGDTHYSCQQDAAGFGLHRRAQFSIWSEETLRSYLDDLYRAAKAGRNLMTIKYARMQNLIPPEKRNPLIEEIVVIQCRWQREMAKKYPYLMGGARHLTGSDDSNEDTSFETYLRGELETYSDNTIKLLYKDMMGYLQMGANGSEKIYEHLVKEMGYSSIKEADRAQK
ncbi:MAG: DUF4125 family protein [Desulfobacterales bacterium]|jgi:hypothetical protein